MTRIFISHSGQNKDIAKELIILLKTGANVVDVFCSSHPGDDILAGENFKYTIDENIKNCDIFIALFTPNYLESSYCLIELGIAAALEKTIIPLVAYGTNYSEMTAVCEHIQGMAINDSNKLPDISDRIRETKHKVSGTLWQDAQNDFVEKVNELLKTQPHSTKVSIEKYNKLLNENKAQTNSIKNLREQLIRTEKELEDVKKCKDAQEVKQVEGQYKDTSSIDKFTELCQEVKNELKQFSGAVQYLCFKYFRDEDATYSDVKFEYNSIDDDIENNLITQDENLVYINAEARKFRKFLDKFKELEDFIKFPPDELVQYVDEELEIDFDIKNKEFWNTRFDLNI